MELPTVLSRVHLTTGHKLRRRDGVGIPDFDEIELRSRRRMGNSKGAHHRQIYAVRASLTAPHGAPAVGRGWLDTAREITNR